MKKKVLKAFESVIYWITVVLAGCGLGAVTSKALGEDAWSWDGWTTKHKIIYYLVTTLLSIPMAIWFVMARLVFREKIDEEDFED